MSVDMVTALNKSLSHEMTHNNNIILFGEDIGHLGGVFRVTQGLQKRFGSDRVVDMPISESLLAGLPIGMSTQGLIPIVEFQFMGFSYPGLDQIINHISRIRHRTQGRLICPVVYRMPYGAGIHAPEHHSDSTESLFASIPGIYVITPSCPKQAYGLMLAAIRQPDPVIFLEPTRLYRNPKGLLDDDGQSIPLEQARIISQGSDVTLISWGAICNDMISVVSHFASKGLSIELIDLQTLKPFDRDSVFRSVKKTGRCIIVHEANGFCGLGAEISAQLAEHMMTYLCAPIKRVTGYDTAIPYYQRELEYIPNPKRVISAIDSLMEY